MCFFKLIKFYLMSKFYVIKHAVFSEEILEERSPSFSKTCALFKDQNETLFAFFTHVLPSKTNT
jgi:hypothetical protein